MEFKNAKNIVGGNFCHSWIPTNPKLDLFRTYGRLLENPKTGHSREFFLSENNFKPCSAVNSKKIWDFGGPETDQRFEIQDWSFSHIFFYIWTEYSLLKWSLIWVYFNYTGSIFPKYVWSIYTSNILKACFEYTSSILQLIDLNEKKYSILQVYIILTKKLYLKRILWNWISILMWNWSTLLRTCAEQTYVLKQFTNQIMAAKCQIMTRSQLEKMDSEQIVQRFLPLQDEILGNQTELLQQNDIVNEILGDLSKKF